MIDGRKWIADRFGADRCARVAAFLDRAVAENANQNLVAPSTLTTIWERHALDSAQLLAFDRPGTWVDIGTGGGFPGFVVALLRDDPVVLVEPRKRRAAFLEESAQALGCSHITVATAKVEHVEHRAAVISARAVALVPALLKSALHLAHAGTRWVLPRGQSGRTELAALRGAWHGMFHVEHSLSDPDATILILDKVRPK